MLIKFCQNVEFFPGQDITVKIHVKTIILSTIPDLVLACMAKASAVDCTCLELDGMFVCCLASPRFIELKIIVFKSVLIFCCTSGDFNFFDKTGGGSKRAESDLRFRESDLNSTTGIWALPVDPASLLLYELALLG